VFARLTTGEVANLPVSLFSAVPASGEHWSLELLPRALLSQSMRLYGSALLGLLLGAGLGALIGRMTTGSGDLGALLLGALGTLTALRISNRHPDVRAVPLLPGQGR
jgi:hypothetical protein